MKKNESQLNKKSKSLIKKSSGKGIVAFTERPSEDTSLDRPEGTSKNLAASELFSFFTADIIREQKIFTR